MAVSNPFRMLYRESRGWLCLWTKGDKRSVWLQYPKDAGEALKRAKELSKTEDVYYGVCLYKESLGASHRGTAKDASVLPALFLDIDVTDRSAHKSSDLPSSMEEAQQFLAGLPLQPSFTIDSGHGIHAYWLFEEPIDIEKVGLDRISRTMKSWNEAINGLAAEHCWKFDMVCEPARVLRVPGTLNHKTGTPVPVGFPVGSGRRYSVDELRDAYETMVARAGMVSEPRSASDPSTRFTLPGRIPEGERNATLYRFACSLRAKGEEEPLIRTKIEAANASACHPPLPASEVTVIVRSACTHPAGVTTNPHSVPATGGQAIILPAAPNVEAMEGRELLSDALLDTILYAPDLVERQLRLTVCRKHARKLGLLRGFNERWNSRLAAHVSASTHLAEGDSRAEEVQLPDAPILGLRIKDWTVNAAGVHRTRFTSGVPVLEEACPHPILIQERLYNVDSHLEKYKITWCRSGERWEDCVVSRSTVASRQSVVGLSDMGVMVTSENAKLLVQFLHELEAANTEIIPKRRSVSHCGWIDHLEFSPYAPDISFDGDPRMRSLYSSVGPSGSWERWLTVAREARSTPTGRAILAASFAAPLVDLLGKQVFFLHFWGATGTGKTVALYLAASVWGAPIALTRTFNSTGVGLERVAAFLHSIPLCLDEFQTLDKRKVDADSLVYQLAEGKSRARGTKTGGIEPESRWANVILTNGEEPMTTSMSGGGAKNRAIELCIDQPVFADAPGLAKVIHANYGHAGKRYIEGLIGEMEDSGLEAIQTVYDRNREAAGYHADYTDKQLTALAILATAEYYACRFVFGMSPEQAEDAATNLKMDMRPKLTSAREVDLGTRAWEWTVGWLVSHRTHFETPIGNTVLDQPVFGVVDGDTWHVIATILDDALLKEGYSPRKCAHEFGRRGWIEQSSTEGTMRNKIKRRIGGTPVWCYKIRLRGDE
jgi:hypothetical protein